MSQRRKALRLNASEQQQKEHEALRREIETLRIQRKNEQREFETLRIQRKREVEQILHEARKGNVGYV